MKTFTQIVKAIEDNKKDLEFMKTGFYKLDDFLDGGFLRKELVVLGAGTGRGKSFVAGNIFYNIAKQGFSSAYFSLEISSEMIASRLIGSLANIKPTRISAGFLTPEEFETKNDSSAEIAAFNKFMFFYDDLYTLNE